MTSRLVSVSAIGMNRIGTLSRYFNNIYKNNGNVQESTLHNVNDIFIMNAQLQFPKSQNINFLYPDFYNFQKESTSNVPFYAIVNPQQSGVYYPKTQIINIKTEISDTCGIVSNQLSSLEKYDCKIRNFTSNCTPAPHSATPIFSFNIEASFKKDNNNINKLIDEIRYTNPHNLCEIVIGDHIITEYDGIGF